MYSKSVICTSLAQQINFISSRLTITISMCTIFILFSLFFFTIIIIKINDGNFLSFTPRENWAHKDFLLLRMSFSRKSSREVRKKYVWGLLVGVMDEGWIILYLVCLLFYRNELREIKESEISLFRSLFSKWKNSGCSLKDLEKKIVPLWSVSWNFFTT